MNLLLIAYAFLIIFFNSSVYGAETTDEVLETSPRTEFIPHYIIPVANAAGFSSKDNNERIQCMQSFLTELPERSYIAEYFKELLANCEVRPGGIISTARENAIYFLRKIAENPEKPHTSSHWVIKQLEHSVTNGEKADLKVILELLRTKSALPLNGRKSFKFAMPECTFTIIGADGKPTYFTLYHRVNHDTLHAILKPPSTTHANADACELYKTLGERMHNLHYTLRPSPEELRALSNKTGEINVRRFYKDSATNLLASIDDELLHYDNPLTRLILTRCMGDMHTRNVMHNFTLIDYVSLARDTDGQNKCSSFANDLSYTMFCCVYFYGKKFITETGVELLGNLLAGYFESVHPDYHARMLEHTKEGFIFFLSTLTKNPEPINTDNFNSRKREIYVEFIIATLNSILFNQHGITIKSSDAEILAAVKNFNETKAYLSNEFINRVLEKTESLLSQTAWQERQVAVLEPIVLKKLASMRK